MKIDLPLKRILYRTGVAIGLALFMHQAWLAVSALAANPTPLRLGYLGPLLALDLIAYVLLIAGWGMITSVLRLNLPVRHLFHGYVLTFLPRYIPGSVWGYVSRGEWMRRTCGASYQQSTTASVMEISVQFGTAGIIVLTGLAPSDWQIAAFVLGLTALALPWWLLLHFYARRQPGQRIGGVRMWGAWLLLLLLYLFFWTVHGLTIGAAMRAVGAPAAITPGVGAFIFCASWLVGFAAIFVPAGLGVREVTLSALLQQRTALSAGDASLVAVLTRLGIIVAELIFLLVAAGLAGLTRWRSQASSYAPDHPDSLL